jgi:hypothetical protein
MSTNKQAAAIIEIDISVQNNTLIVGVNGGNVTGASGDTIVWRAGSDAPAFTLQFFRLAAEPAAKADCEPIDVAELPRWPFAEPAPPNGSVGPTRTFSGTLAGKAPPATAFKYYVSVGNLQLDPIVILDHHH